MNEIKKFDLSIKKKKIKEQNISSINLFLAINDF